MTYMRRVDGEIATDYRQHRDRVDTRKGDRHKPRKGDRHRGSRNHGSHTAMPHGLATKFVAIDGEAFENGYCLLDSSISEYPRLYSTEPLTARQIFTWLWGLASLPQCQDAHFVLYGAGYDFNNWLHDVLHLSHGPTEDCDDHTCICRLCDGDYVETGTEYQVKWIRQYKFSLRKFQVTDAATPVKYKRKWGLARELTMWDVSPFFSKKSFIDALELYDITVPQIIQDGKDARGTFLHSQLEWVSQYNCTECTLLIQLLDRLKGSFETTHIEPAAWNGAGAAAKALLRREGVAAHNGRGPKGKRVGRGQYLCPEPVRDAMWSAFIGGMFRVLSIGHTDHVYDYDIQSAYPFQLTMLPCLTHGHWEHSDKYIGGTFGIWDIEYQNFNRRTPDYLEPFPTRLGTGVFYLPYCHRWMYSCEVDGWLKWHRTTKGRWPHSRKLTIRGGWYWVPERCEKPFPFQWVHKEAMTRLAFKHSGLIGAALVLKLALNSLYGSLAQSRGMQSVDDPSWSQQMLWAGWITAATRIKLWSAAMTAPESVVHLATDGILTTEPLSVPLTDRLGDWERKDLYDFTVVQCGIYFHRDGLKTRGFTPYGLNPTEELRERIHSTWRAQRYKTIDYQINGFVGAHQVRQGTAPLSEWCHWTTEDKLLDICFPETNFECLSENWPSPDTLTRVTDNVFTLALPYQKPQSEPYKPHLSKWYKWPTQYEDELLLPETV